MNLKVVEIAREYIGTPYIHQARVKGHGIDCAGLLICVAKELGVCPADYDSNEYAWLTDGAQLISELEKWCSRIANGQLEPGDIAVFDVIGSPQHAAFIGDHPTGLSMIHAYPVAGEVIEHRFDERWKGRLLSRWRLNG